MLTDASPKEELLLNEPNADRTALGSIVAKEWLDQVNRDYIALTGNDRTIADSIIVNNIYPALEDHHEFSQEASELEERKESCDKKVAGDSYDNIVEEINSNIDITFRDFEREYVAFTHEEEHLRYLIEQSQEYHVRPEREDGTTLVEDIINLATDEIPLSEPLETLDQEIRRVTQKEISRARGDNTAIAESLVRSNRHLVEDLVSIQEAINRIDSPQEIPTYYHNQDDVDFYASRIRRAREYIDNLSSALNSKNPCGEIVVQAAIDIATNTQGMNPSKHFQRIDEAIRNQQMEEANQLLRQLDQGLRNISTAAINGFIDKREEGLKTFVPNLDSLENNDVINAIANRVEHRYLEKRLKADESSIGLSIQSASTGLAKLESFAKIALITSQSPGEKLIITTQMGFNRALNTVSAALEREQQNITKETVAELTASHIRELEEVKNQPSVELINLRQQFQELNEQNQTLAQQLQDIQSRKLEVELQLSQLGIQLQQLVQENNQLQQIQEADRQNAASLSSELDSSNQIQIVIQSMLSDPSFKVPEALLENPTIARVIYFLDEYRDLRQSEKNLRAELKDTRTQLSGQITLLQEANKKLKQEALLSRSRKLIGEWSINLVRGYIVKTYPLTPAELFKFMVEDFLRSERSDPPVVFTTERGSRQEIINITGTPLVNRIIEAVNKLPATYNSTEIEELLEQYEVPERDDLRSVISAYIKTAFYKQNFAGQIKKDPLSIARAFEKIRRS